MLLNTWETDICLNQIHALHSQNHLEDPVLCEFLKSTMMMCIHLPTRYYNMLKLKEKKKLSFFSDFRTCQAHSGTNYQSVLDRVAPF